MIYHNRIMGHSDIVNVTIYSTKVLVLYLAIHV